MTPREIPDEAGEIADRSAAPIVRVINRLARARIAQVRDGSSDYGAWSDAMDAARALFGRLLAYSDLLGRRRAELLYRAAARQADRAERASLAAEATLRFKDTPLYPLLPQTEFEQAVGDVLAREPEIAVGYEAVQNLYRDRHAFACAKSMDVAVTKAVQRVIARYVGGDSIPSPERLIAELGGWSEGYASTVFRTNVATAYSAGVWARMTEPDVADVLLGAEFHSMHLPTSRPNHEACAGLVAPSSSRLWDVYSPPLGYQCRDTISEVSRFDARRRGLLNERGGLVTVLPPGFGISARPDPGFGLGRPDRRVRDERMAWAENAAGGY